MNSKHNLSVTEKIVTQVMLGKEYSSKGSISCKWDYIHSFYVTLHNFLLSDAAKKFHEYLVRQNKPTSEEERNATAKLNRITQRRQRVS